MDKMAEAEAQQYTDHTEYNVSAKADTDGVKDELDLWLDDMLASDTEPAKVPSGPAASRRPSIQDLGNPAKALIMLEAPPHLDKLCSMFALIGARVITGSLTRVYREMARYLHPDKHDQAASYMDAFKMLGKLQHDLANSSPSDLKKARACEWRVH